MTRDGHNSRICLLGVDVLATAGWWLCCLVSSWHLLVFGLASWPLRPAAALLLRAYEGSPAELAHLQAGHGARTAEIGSRVPDFRLP
jgi:hypothetical protein